MIKVEHHGTPIEYNEQADRWVFTIRGRERKVESLAKAKEVIDKPEPKEKKSFERIKCFATSRWGNNAYQEIEVTSIAANTSQYTSSRQEVWTVNKGEREKRYSDDCFPVTDANRRIVGIIKSIDKQIDILQAQRNKEVDKLTPLKIKE